MNATLSFSLPEEAREHHDAVMGTEWRCACMELDSLLRNRIKYNYKTTLEEIRRAFREDLASRGLTVDL